MYLRVLERCVLIYMNLILQNFLHLKSDLLTDIDWLLMVETGIRWRICLSNYRYAKINNKYIKHYHKNKKSSYLQYWNASNLYGWAMSRKVPVNNFEWLKDTSQFSEDFIEIYKEKNDVDICKKLVFSMFSWCTWTS